MAIDHSAGDAPPYIQREDALAAFEAIQITPPSWAASVDLMNDGGVMRVASSGTDGSTLSADYITIPADEGYSLQLQGSDTVGAARAYYVAGADATVDIAFVYRGNG